MALHSSKGCGLSPPAVIVVSAISCLRPPSIHQDGSGVHCEQGWWLSPAADLTSDTRHMIIKQIYKKIPLTPSLLAFTLDVGHVHLLAQFSPWEQMDVAVPSPLATLAGGGQMVTEGKRVQILQSGRNCRNP